MVMSFLLFYALIKCNITAKPVLARERTDFSFTLQQCMPHVVPDGADFIGMDAGSPANFRGASRSRGCKKGGPKRIAHTTRENGSCRPGLRFRDVTLVYPEPVFDTAGTEAVPLLPEFLRKSTNSTAPEVAGHPERP